MNKSIKFFFVTVVIFFFLPIQVCLAASWFVVPDGSATPGNGGTSYADAWNGFDDIDWGTLGAGDTLYLVGSFAEGNLNVKTGGDANNDFSIRGDHTEGQGTITNGSLRWVGGNSSYITVDGLTIINGNVSYAGPIGAGGVAVGVYKPANAEFISPDILRDPDKGFVSRYLPGMMFAPVAGELKNRGMYMISSVTDQGAYDEIIIDTSPAAKYSFVDEGPGPKNLDAYWPNHHITVQNCKISNGTNKGVVSTRGTDITIRNNDLDNQDVATSGALYIAGKGLWKRHANITITGNYIHNVGDPTYAPYDAHCIGVQPADNVVITRNHFKECGAAIVFYNSATGASGDIGDWEITYNFIENMDYNRAPPQWGGSGIIFTGTGTVQPGTIAHNVIVNPLNCPGTTTTVNCRGIRYNRQALTKIYNNTIVGADYGLELLNAGSQVHSSDVRNNIVINSNIAHIRSGSTFTTHIQDYNVYYPDTGTEFLISNTPYDFAGYNAILGASYNTNSSTSDPGLNSVYAPSSASSFVVDSGDPSLVTTHIRSIERPDPTRLNTFVLGDDSTSPDTGAFMYGDWDDDTISDSVDNCVFVSNAGQTDSNGNGRGDACIATISGYTIGLDGTTDPNIVVAGSNYDASASFLAVTDPAGYYSVAVADESYWVQGYPQVSTGCNTYNPAGRFFWTMLAYAYGNDVNKNLNCVP